MIVGRARDGFLNGLAIDEIDEERGRDEETI